MNFSEEENSKIINKFFSRKIERSKSRSRSRSLSLRNENINKKKSRNRKCYSSSSSNSKMSSIYADFDRKLNNLRRETKNHKKERNDSPIKHNFQIKLPNKGILANIIQHNIKINKKMDKLEIDRATNLLRQVDSNKNKTATMMSTFLNSNITFDDEEFIYEKINGEILKINKDFICEIKVKLFKIFIFIEMQIKICLFKRFKKSYDNA